MTKKEYIDVLKAVNNKQQMKINFLEMICIANQARGFQY